MTWDLNCDLGEGEPLATTRALMRSISSANVACGGHAGDVGSMELCVSLAKQFRVRLGAHPGIGSEFGRGPVEISPSLLELLLLQQVSALQKVASAQQVRLHHIKLHGSLYHAVESNSLLARRYVAAVARWWPEARIFARSSGLVEQAARKRGTPLWREVFADRAYNNNLTLVPRAQAGAVLDDLEMIVERVKVLAAQGVISTVQGKTVRLAGETLCLHSDTPGAARTVRSVAKALGLRRSDL
jgi:UPF0271 protein